MASSTTTAGTATTARHIAARPLPFPIDPTACALLVIDMQHDFLSPGGWIDTLGMDVALLKPAAMEVEFALRAARQAGLAVLHTQEGYAPDLSDYPQYKRDRSPINPGDEGAHGRYMIRGEHGHSFVAPYRPLPGETVFQKAGAGAFSLSDIEEELRARGIRQLVVCGVTIDCCVLATLYEANDRGFECLLLGDATGCYSAQTTASVIAMLEVGVIACVAHTGDFVSALETVRL